MMINNETRIVIIKLFIKQIKCSQVEAVDADWDLFPAVRCSLLRATILCPLSPADDYDMMMMT